MASKSTSFLALFLALNLIFFTFANACGDCPKPKPPPKCPPPPKKSPPKPPSPTPKPPTPSTPSVPPSQEKCPKDTLKLGVCANVLSIIGISLGSPPDKQCCALIGGLADTEAAICLCTALKANVLGINLNIPIALSVILNNCGKKIPSGFQCSSE